MRETAFKLIGLATLLSITACGALDNRGKAVVVNPDANHWTRVASDSQSDSSIKFFGFIDVSLDEDGSSQFFEAGFFAFNKSAPISVLLASFRQPEIDSCEYYESKSGKPFVQHDELELPGYPYQAAPSGRIVEISHRGRRYVKLEFTGTDDAVQYETDTGSLGITFGGLKLGDALLKTSQLRAHAPGDNFPAFSDVPIPPVDRVKGFNLSVYDSVSSSTDMRWRKGHYSSDPDVRVQIEAGGAGRSLFCAVADDGRFRLPISVTNQLGEKSIINPSIFRDVIHFYQSGDALLIVSQSSYY